MRPIVVYTTADDVPESIRCVGFFRGNKGFLPLRINGPTPDAVRENAEKWWTEESARQKKIKGGRPSVSTDKPPEVADKPPETSRSVDFEDLLA